MKLNKHYTFDLTGDITTPFVTVYDSDKIGIWQMGTEIGVEFRIEMTFKQGEEVAQRLAQLIAARRDKDNPQVVHGHYDKEGNFVEDINEEQADDDMLERAAHH